MDEGCTTETSHRIRAKFESGAMPGAPDAFSRVSMDDYLPENSVVFNGLTTCRSLALDARKREMRNLLGEQVAQS